MAREHFELPHMSGLAPGFGWIIKDGGTIYLSGQVGIGHDGNLADGFSGQVRQAFENIRESLEIAGAGAEEVVQLMFFLKAHGEATFLQDMDVVVEHKEAILPGATPVGTSVRVVELFLPEVLFEVQAVATVATS